MANVEDADALLAAAVVDREEVAAGEREEVLDAARAERPGDQPAAVDGGGLGGLVLHGRHAGEPNAIAKTVLPRGPAVPGFT